MFAAIKSTTRNCITTTQNVFLALLLKVVVTSVVVVNKNAPEHWLKLKIIYKYLNLLKSNYRNQLRGKTTRQMHNVLPNTDKASRYSPKLENAVNVYWKYGKSLRKWMYLGAIRSQYFNLKRFSRQSQSFKLTFNITALKCPHWCTKRYIQLIISTEYQLRLNSQCALNLPVVNQKNCLQIFQDEDWFATTGIRMSFVGSDMCWETVNSVKGQAKDFLFHLAERNIAYLAENHCDTTNVTTRANSRHKDLVKSRIVIQAHVFHLFYLQKITTGRRSVATSPLHLLNITVIKPNLQSHKTNCILHSSLGQFSPYKE